MISQPPASFDLGKMHARRRVLSERFIHGQGIEIGALHQPLWVPPSAHVTYVDRMTVDSLRQQYPELAALPLTPVGRVDDGETLATFPDQSLHFIIANHMLEHCENPIGTVRCHLAKLKPGGILYYAIPDKRKTFDVKRPLTDWKHFDTDDRLGPSRSREAHFREYASLVENAPDGEPLDARVRHLMTINYSIHFHVWDAESFGAFVENLRTRLRFEVLVLEENEMEVVAILRKRAWLGARWLAKLLGR